MHEFMRGHTVRQLQCDLSKKKEQLKSRRRTSPLDYFRGSFSSFKAGLVKTSQPC